MIIDIHCHLGDILYPGGGRLIWEKGVRKTLGIDLISMSEASLHNSLGGTLGLVNRCLSGMVIRAERRRNATATLENILAAMEKSGVERCACMPIPPNVSFDDLAAAAAADDRIIPFTGVDFASAADPTTTLGRDVARGARGLKLHPVIQQRSLDGSEVMAAVEAFAPHGLPVLFHCGISTYYLGEEGRSRQNPRLGNVADARKLAAAFPRVTFIAGHAGLFDVRAVMDLLGPLPNVAVDISFQSPATIRELLRVFGPDRVLFASDWPYGNHRPAICAVERACGRDSALVRKVLGENAARLLKLDGGSKQTQATDVG